MSYNVMSLDKLRGVSNNVLHATLKATDKTFSYPSIAIFNLNMNIFASISLTVHWLLETRYKLLLHKPRTMTELVKITTNLYHRCPTYFKEKENEALLTIFTVVNTGVYHKKEVDDLKIWLCKIEVQTYKRFKTNLKLM